MFSIDPADYNGIKWRNIGPYRGGRANAIAGVSGNDQIYYAGYTGGGVWKTEDAGYNWYNISDGYFKVGSIGDIAVSKSDPNVIYIGSGEHAVRGVMTSYGDGVYKSADAGNTWVNVGLEKTRHITDVLIHPTNPDIVYVGAQGPVHGSGTERGVFKSEDGGNSWSKILFIDENTGVSSLVMDPSNPRILFAATWQHRRYPWKVESGGPGSAIYKSTDSGKTWKKLTEGLPKEMGKIGLSVSAVNSNRVFAVIETVKEKAGLYRSDDGGSNWRLMSNNQALSARSWYYMEVFADPNNEDLVYVLNAPLMKSIDGGKTFESMRVIHGDCHDFYINPENSDNIAMAEDGGATISFSKGKVWSTFNNQPTAQFYRVTADNQNPYWVYGGQQDNFSVGIPSRTKGYGILTKDWINGPGCESAMVAFDDPNNPRVLYGGCFNGRISLLDTKTMEAKNIQPYPMTNLGYKAKDMKYRFNWNAPLINSPHDPKTMYYGGNVLFKSTNGGMEWSVASPDLTRNDESKQQEGGGPFTNEGAGGENYNTIYYVAESAHEEGVIYTGSDCGLIQLTRDGGKTWVDITPEGLPETMIHAIEVSPHDPATVYFASTRYKFNDLKNYSYKSTDYGTTWTKIGDNINKDDFFRVIREDPNTKDLLYAGGERGFYISYDGGNTFNHLQLNLPVVPITDLTIRDNDLIAATAGRSFWILDDISFLQQSAGKLGNQTKLFQPKIQTRQFGAPPFYLITEHGFGQNPPEGVTLTYYLSDVSDEDTLMLDIIKDGEVIRSYQNAKMVIENPIQGGRGNLRGYNYMDLPIQKGLNRFTWDYGVNGLPKIEDTFILEADYRGHRVGPGVYTARLTYKGQTGEARIEIMNPPDIITNEQMWETQQKMLSELENRIADIIKSIDNTMNMSEKINSISDQIKGNNDLIDLNESAEELSEKIKDWQSKVVELRQKGFQDALNWPAGIISEYFYLRNNLDTYDPTVPSGYVERFNDLESTWDEYDKVLNELIENDVRRFNDLYRSKEIPAISVPKTDEIINN